MVWTSFVPLHFVVLMLCAWSVSCASEDEKKAVMEVMKPLVMECFDSLGIDPEEFKEKGHDEMDPRFKKCLFQKLGLIESNGDYNKDSVDKQLKEFVSDDDERKQMQDTIENCFKGKEKASSNDDDEMTRINDVFECLKKSEKQ